MRSLSLPLGLSLIGGMGGLITTTSCGDDNSGATCGAGTTLVGNVCVANDVDAAVDAPHFFKGFLADEGGEVKIEYLLFTNNNIGGRVQRFVLKNSGAVPYHPIPTPGVCTNVDKAQGNFPTAQNADRVYADPGLVIISNPTGLSPTMTLQPNAAAGVDSAGRSHPAGMYTVASAAGGPFLGSADTSGALYFPEKTGFDVTFTGSADLPAQTFKEALWMPASTLLVSPPLGSYSLLAGVDQTITMSMPANEDGLPAGVDVRELVAFTGGMGIQEFCLDPLVDEAVKITAAAADHVRAVYPTGGTMARMNLTHQVRELVDFDGPTGRRVDFISNWCNATPFTVP